MILFLTKKQLLIILAVLALPIFVRAASFDCAKAGTAVEKLICSDAEVSQLDEQLAQAYKAGMEKADNKETFKQAQRAWLKEKRNACKDAACLAQVYTSRINQLNSHSHAKDVAARVSTTIGQPVAVNSSSAGYTLPNSQNIEDYKRPLTFVHTYGNSYPICKPYMDMLNEAKYMNFPASERKILPKYSQFKLLDWIEVMDETEKIKAIESRIIITGGISSTATKRQINMAIKSAHKSYSEGRVRVFKTDFDFDKDKNFEIIYNIRVISESDNTAFTNSYYVSDTSIHPEDVINSDGTINPDQSSKYVEKRYSSFSLYGHGQFFLFKDKLYMSHWYSNWGPQTNALEIWAVGKEYFNKICGFKIIGQ